MKLPDKEWIDFIGFLAQVATLVTLLFAVAAVLYAARQLSLSRKATSAAAVIPLNDTFRECWTAYIGATKESDRRFHFGELANALELACAMFRDKILFGASREILENYLVNVFEIIDANPNAKKLLDEFLETPKTFENIVYFLHRHEKPLSLARTMSGLRSAAKAAQATNTDAKSPTAVVTK